MGLAAPALRTLTFAHSPDPDDAYMFYGFASGAVKIPGHEIRHHLEDIQSLNERALPGDFEITAVSAHAYAHISDRYWALSCGASVGRRYGPILVSASSPADTGGGSNRASTMDSRPPPLPVSGRKQGPSAKRSAFGRSCRWATAGNDEIKTIAIPGQWTTAALVLDLWLAEQGVQPEKVIMPFDQILDAVEHGVVDAGLIIHEGQLTYQRQGLHKLWDAGEWWHAEHRLPLPLGLDVVRTDLGLPLAQEISRALRASIEYANAHQEKAIEYALQYGRGLDPTLAKRFVGMYVNEDTLTQGDEVQAGLKKLYELAYQAKLIPQNPDVHFI